MTPGSPSPRPISGCASPLSRPSWTQQSCGCRRALSWRWPGCCSGSPSAPDPAVATPNKPSRRISTQLKYGASRVIGSSPQALRVPTRSWPLASSVSAASPARFVHDTRSGRPTLSALPPLSRVARRRRLHRKINCLALRQSCPERGQAFPRNKPCR